MSISRMCVTLKRPATSMSAKVIPKPQASVLVLVLLISGASRRYQVLGVAWKPRPAVRMQPSPVSRT